MTAAGGKSAKGLTLDTGALLALERGSPRVRALLRRALEAGLPLSVPAGVVAQAWRGGPRQARVARLLADPDVRVQNICVTADQLLQKFSGIPELPLLWIVAIRHRTNDHPLSGIFLRIFNFRPLLHIKESAPFLRVSGKALHKRSIAILAGMCTAYIGIDRVTAYRQTGLGHDVLCFHLTNEDSIDYFCHDPCTPNTLLNSSGIS